MKLEAVSIVAFWLALALFLSVVSFGPQYCATEMAKHNYAAADIRRACY